MSIDKLKFSQLANQQHLTVQRKTDKQKKKEKQAQT
jgi:hypothetical protein